MTWILLVLAYGIIKGFREIFKKKALQRSSTIEVLFLYTFISFALVIPEAKNALSVDINTLLIVMAKSFTIFLAWICGFKAISKMPVSLYGILDLSRVLFSTSLGVIVLKESLGNGQIIGLILVVVGLLLLKVDPQKIYGSLKKTPTNDSPADSFLNLNIQPTDLSPNQSTQTADSSPNQNTQTADSSPNQSTQPTDSSPNQNTQTADSFLNQNIQPADANVPISKINAEAGDFKTSGRNRTFFSTGIICVLLAFISAFLNAVSGTMDKWIMTNTDISEGHLQFWYMLFLVAFYLLFILVNIFLNSTRSSDKKFIFHLKSALKNYWIWILAIIFVIGDRCLFIANNDKNSTATVMTLLKQSSCIVTILAGKIIFHEKNIVHKLFCATTITAGIVISILL